MMLGSKLKYLYYLLILMIVEKAYLDMYPDKELGRYRFSLNYSGKFKGYNANVKKTYNNIQFNLSKEWRKIGEEVKIGLIQHLMNKIFNTKVRTQNQELYDIFLKKVHIAVKKDKIDPVLEESFNRVNEKYFYGLIETPNLIWGRDSTTKLGSYDYGSDTISVSSIFRNSSSDLLDYIMYHEILHKKHKFSTKNGRSYHHTRQFNKDERKFQDFTEVEKDLEVFLRRMKRFKYDF